MFHSCTEPCVKKDVKNFFYCFPPSVLKIATVAFGMGVHIHDIRNITHTLGSCEYIEMYVHTSSLLLSPPQITLTLIVEVRHPKTHDLIHTINTYTILAAVN